MNKYRIDRGGVLVVDRDPITLVGTAGILHYYGHECLCARNSTAASVALQSGAVDLVVLDVGDQGSETLQRIADFRQMSQNDDLPVIVLAAPEWNGLEKQLEILQTVRCLFKPIDPRVLGDLVQQVLLLPLLLAGARQRGSRPGEPQSHREGWVSL